MVCQDLVPNYAFVLMEAGAIGDRCRHFSRRVTYILPGIFSMFPVFKLLASHNYI